MKLELNKVYKGKVEGLNIPGLDEKQTKEFVSSGRICGVMLEGIIANQFEGMSQGTQGNDADIYWNDKTIQCKTARPKSGIFKTGPRKGMEKVMARDSWVSKSGLFDKTPGKQISVEDYYDQLNSYYDKYDYFMIINIAKMNELEYEFICVESSLIKEINTDGKISWGELSGKV